MSIRPSGETADYRRGYEDGCKATRENIDEAAKLRALAKQASPAFRELTNDLAAPPAEAPGERGDVIGRLEQTHADLGEHRQTHVVWRDWLQKDPSNATVNPHAGSAEFHANVILDYDRHLSNIRAAIAQLAAAPAAPAEGDKPVARIGVGHNVIGMSAPYVVLTDAGRALPPGTYDCYTAHRVTGGRELAEKVLAALGHAPKVSDQCTARVVHQYPVGKPPGPGNPPIFCCLKTGHEGQHRCNHGGMSPSFPFRDNDEVEFREPVTCCAKCGTQWPCPSADAALQAATGGASNG